MALMMVLMLIEGVMAKSEGKCLVAGPFRVHARG
jgi:hypothetical protein